MYIQCRNMLCRLTLLVMGESDEIQHAVGPLSEFHPGKYICPVCGSSMLYNAPVPTGTVRMLEPQEACAALRGMGFPEEIPCTEESVQRVLRESPVVYVHTSLARGSTRVYVDYVRLANGVRVYFGATAYGACVLRIALPKKTVEDSRGLDSDIARDPRQPLHRGGPHRDKVLPEHGRASSARVACAELPAGGHFRYFFRC